MSLVVLKGGGSVVETTAEAARAWAAAGHRVCVVHGAGSNISAEMQKRGIEVRFVGGRRVTDRQALGVVRRSFEEVNLALCQAIGPPAVGFVGAEVGLVAEHIPELGFVGKALPSRPPLVVFALEQGRIPVVAPLAAGPLNVNADEAAAALSLGLGAGSLHFVADVPGVLLDGAVVPTIGVGEALHLLETGALQGGMVPKVKAAVLAAREGLEVRIGETSVVTLEESRSR